MTTRLYSNPICLDHLTPPGHPERPDRLRALEAALEHDNFAALDRQEAKPSAPDMVLLAHPEHYLRRIERSIPEEGFARIDADTSVSPQSLVAALAGVGGAISAVDDVMGGAADNAFVATRPPGHHAERDRAMGFCLFNQAAIAARYAQKTYGIERVAIVDWDVHHGNGTQDIFWDDPSVVYCSTHQMPLYPGTGARGETGAGNIVNAPLSPNDGTDHFHEAFRIARSAGAGRGPAGPDHHLRGLRCPLPGSAGGDKPGRRRLRLGDGEGAGRRRTVLRQPGRQHPRRRLRSGGARRVGGRAYPQTDERLKDVRSDPRKGREE